MSGEKLGKVEQAYLNHIFGNITLFLKVKGVKVNFDFGILS